RGPLPFARRRRPRAASRPRHQRPHALGHRDGPAPPRPSGLRRAVSPRVDPDAGGAEGAPQLPRVEGVTLREAIQAAIEGRHLSRADAAAAVDAMLDGTAPPTLIAALLIALRVKGETPDEIAGAAQALRARAARVEVSLDRLLDTCGTGGDAPRGARAEGTGRPHAVQFARTAGESGGSAPPAAGGACAESRDGPRADAGRARCRPRFRGARPWWARRNLAGRPHARRRSA